MTKKTNPEKNIDSTFYPTIELTNGNHASPNIRLPNNYKELVPTFYSRGGREEIEAYSKKLQELLKSSNFATRVRLVWETDKREKLTDGGLTHILTNGKSRMNLEENAEHHTEYRGENLNIKNCLISETIAIQYIALLLRYNEIRTSK